MSLTMSQAHGRWSRVRREAGLSVAILALATFLSVPLSVAQASFPGTNGLLTFDVYRDTTSIGNETCSTRNCQILRMYSLRPGARRVAPVPTCRSRECQDRYPAWSADGRRLAFMRLIFLDPGNAEPTRQDLGVFRARAEARVLEQDAAVPAWGPQGELTFLRGTRLVIRSPDGTVSSLATGAGIPNHPDWSSRGTIVYTKAQGDRPAGLFTLRPGGKPRRIARDARDPSWAPDGRRIVFTRLSKPGLWVISTRGGRPRRIGTYSGDSPTWSPNGRWIAFYRRRSIYVVRPDGSRIRRLYRLRRPGLLNHLSWQSLQRKDQR